MAKFQKGQSGNASGRPKGVPNKMTKSLKEAVLEAFEEAGGAQYLLQVAHKEPKAFLTLLGKLVPIEASVTGELEIKKAIVEFIENQDGTNKSQNTTRISTAPEREKTI